MTSGARRRPASPHSIRIWTLSGRVLYARRIDTLARLEAFWSDSFELANPFSMAGMNEAVARLRQALIRQEPIVVYGDYDVDGISATVLLVSALRKLGGRVSYYVPDRFSEAYGLNNDALTHLYESGARLVVTVDCGIRSPNEVAHAHSLGLDIIVTDHHSVPAQLPSTPAVIDPKRSDCPYPFKELAGVGVAYRLADALFRVQARMTGFDPSCLDELLDLVELGTVADIVPLIDENRTLVRRGLERMRSVPRPGLQALMDVAGVKVEDVDSQDIAFRLGPRLNAAGRLQHASLAYDLLMAETYEAARPLAEQLDAVNRERQSMLEKQVEQARQGLGDLDGRPLLLVHGPDYHEGLVGLIASRLTEEFYRPTLVMRAEEEGARGSARSVEGFHITHALDACADLLSRYGGHERAAGFSLPNENIPALYERLLAYADEPRTYTSTGYNGNQIQQVFNRYDFLEQDEYGNWYYDDQYLFSVDETGMHGDNTAFMLEDLRTDLEIGAYGPRDDPETMLSYWQEKEIMGYPNAKRNVERWQNRLEAMKRQAQMTQIHGPPRGIPPTMGGGGIEVPQM